MLEISLICQPEYCSVVCSLNWAEEKGDGGRGLTGDGYYNFGVGMGKSLRRGEAAIRR